VKVAFNNDESFAFLETRAFSPSPGRRKRRMQAAKLSGPTWEPVQIPYERTTLPGYFYKVDNSGRPRPTIIFFGGFDSSIEELFYYGGAPGRGYNCLTFDGPGQGAPYANRSFLSGTTGRPS